MSIGRAIMEVVGIMLGVVALQLAVMEFLLR